MLDLIKTIYYKSVKLLTRIHTIEYSVDNTNTIKKMSLSLKIILLKGTTLFQIQENQITLMQRGMHYIPMDFQKVKNTRITHFNVKGFRGR